MALMNRWQISNFLDSREGNAKDWFADFVGETYDFGGWSAAVQMENGTGKTTSAEAVLGLISRDRALMKRTVSKMAPSASGHLSHIRIEFLLPDEDLRTPTLALHGGGSLGRRGERWVLGLYGNRDDGRPIYYYYPGTLEEWPVHVEETDHAGMPAKSPIDDEVFRTCRPAKVKTVDTDKAWADVVSSFLSPLQVAQLVQYQRSGAGDKSASLFFVKPSRGEPYDEAFFRQIVAREILAGVGDDGGAGFETKVVRQTQAVIDAQMTTESKRKKLEIHEDDLKALSRVNETAAAWSRARDAYGEAAKAHHRNAAAVLHLLGRDGLKGSPFGIDVIERAVAANGLKAEDREILEHMFWIPTGDVGVTLKLFERRLPKGHGIPGAPAHLFLHHKIGDQGFAVGTLSDIEEYAQGPRAPDDAKDRSSILDLAKRCRRLISLVETHPLRLQYERTVTAYKTEVADHERHKARYTDILARIAEHRQAIDAFSENEQDYRAVANATHLFSPIEIQHPGKARHEIRTSLESSRKTKNSLIQEEVHLRFQKENWDKVTTEFPGNSPRKDLDSLRESKRVADAALSDADADLRSKEDAQADEQHKLDRARSDEAVQKERLAALAPLAAAHDQVLQRFGAEHPDAIATALEKAVLTAGAEIERHAREAQDQRALMRRHEQDAASADRSAEAARTALARLHPLSKALDAFHAAHPGRDPVPFEREETSRREQAIARAARQRTIAAQLRPLRIALEEFVRDVADADPGAWMAQARRERDAATLTRSEAADRIRLHEIRLEALLRNPVAPTTTDLQARKLLDGLPATPLYEVLAGLDLGPARLSLALDHFSAMLFAPTFDDERDATEAARRLADGGIPIPVLVAADLERLLSDGVELIRASDATVRGVFTGVPTRATACLLDPRKIEEERAAEQVLLDRARRDHAGADAVMARLADDSPLMTLARKAVSAVEEDAAGNEKVALAAADAADAEALSADESLASPGHDVVVDAATFVRQGGSAAVLRQQSDLEEAENRKEEAIERRLEAEGRATEADIALEKARGARDVAIAENARWSDLLTKASGYLREGGDAARKRAAEFLADAEARAVAATQTLGSVAGELVRLRLARTNAESAARDAIGRLGTWSAPLTDAAAFQEAGGLDRLAELPGVHRALDDLVATAERKLEFRLDKAQAYLDAGGDAGADEAKDKLAALETEVKGVKERLDLLEAGLPNLHSAVVHSRGNCQRAENAIRDMLSEHTAAQQIIDKFPAPGPSQDDLSEEREIARLALRAELDGRYDDLAAMYESAHRHIQGFQLASAIASIKELDEALWRTNRLHIQQIKDAERTIDKNSRGLHEQLAAVKNDPAGVAELYRRQENGVLRERQFFEQAQVQEEANRAELINVLKGLAGGASQNLRVMRRVFQKGDGAKIDLNVSVADDTRIEAVLNDSITIVSAERRRREDVQAYGDEDEEAFRERVSARVRDTVYRRLFVKDGGDAMITIAHPSLREGRPFRFSNERISGGQATALMLLWTIKLAEYSIAREVARLSGSARGRARTSMHTVVIIDGLFSDLSEPHLIRESMEAMKSMRSDFQLIGLIHSPFYRNDWELFPTWISGRKVTSQDDRGRKAKTVSLSARRQEDVGRTRIAAYTAIPAARVADA